MHDGWPILTPLSWLYRGGVAAVRVLRTSPAPSARLPRIISVGNLEVGGSGKTPLALLLVEHAARAGRRTAYVSRGFASDAEHGPLVTVVPGEHATAPADFAGLRIVARDTPDLAAAAGDEGALVARRAPRVPLFLTADKRRAVNAAAQSGAEIIIVDDAFQSFGLSRHVDVLLLDARRPLGNGRLLPAGRLREAPAAITRADVVVFNGAGSAAAIEEARARVAKWLRAGQRVYGLRRDVTLVGATASARARPASAMAVAAIAKPDDFRRSLEEVGVRVVGSRVFRDHHRYTQADARALREAGGADLGLITTEKDWMKLARFGWGEKPVWVARLEVDLVGGEAMDAWVLP